jgi:hypothetical protein
MIFPLAFNSTDCVQIMNESILFFNQNIIFQKYVKGMNNYRILLHKFSMCLWFGLFLILCLDLALLKIFRFNKGRGIFLTSNHKLHKFFCDLISFSLIRAIKFCLKKERKIYYLKLKVVPFLLYLF